MSLISCSHTTSCARSGLVPIENITEFELVFMNGDSVLVDSKAVLRVEMVTGNQEMSWDARHSMMCVTQNLKSFNMSMDIRAVQLFRRRYISALGEGVDSRNADGMAAVERIRTSHDLTHIYINGTAYTMPTKWDDHEHNLLQTTSELTTSEGDHQIDIRIIPESDCGKICVY